MKSRKNYLHATASTHHPEAPVPTVKGQPGSPQPWRYAARAGDVVLICANGSVRWFCSQRAGLVQPSHSPHWRRPARRRLPSRRGEISLPMPSRVQSLCSTAPWNTSAWRASPRSPTASLTGAATNSFSRPISRFRRWRRAARLPPGPRIRRSEHLRPTHSSWRRARIAYQAPQCPTARPFLIKDVRWQAAGFPTDRGKMQMSAWLFDISEIDAYLGYSAFDPSAFWRNGVSPQGMMGGRISADGLTLTLGTIGGPETPGPCGEDLSASAAESDTAVAVAIATRFHTPPAGEGCSLVGYSRTIAVRLSRPLGGRVLADPKGDAGTVCVEAAAC